MCHMGLYSGGLIHGSLRYTHRSHTDSKLIIHVTTHHWNCRSLKNILCNHFKLSSSRLFTYKLSTDFPNNTSLTVCWKLIFLHPATPHFRFGPGLYKFCAIFLKQLERVWFTRLNESKKRYFCKTFCQDTSSLTAERNAKKLFSSPLNKP